MSQALVIMGAIAIMIGLVAGFFSGTVSGFILFLAGGSFAGMVLFAFSRIIDNQISILYQLQIQNEYNRELHKKIIDCPNCDYEYDVTYSSCPNCGHRKAK